MKMSLVLVCEMPSSLTIELFTFQGSYGIVKLAVNHDDQGQYVSFVTFCSSKNKEVLISFFYTEKILVWFVTLSSRTKVVLFPFSFRRWKSFQRKSSSEKEASSVSFLLSKTKSWFHESTTKAFIYSDIYNVGLKSQSIIFRNEINQYSRCPSKKGFFFSRDVYSIDVTYLTFRCISHRWIFDDPAGLN